MSSFSTISGLTKEGGAKSDPRRRRPRRPPAQILATYSHAECANYRGSAGYAYAEMQKVLALCRRRLEWGQHVEAFHSPIRVAVKKPNRDAPPSSTKSNGI
jgi:hypothetical protein